MKLRTSKIILAIAGTLAISQAAIASQIERSVSGFETTLSATHEVNDENGVLQLFTTANGSTSGFTRTLPNGEKISYMNVNGQTYFGNDALNSLSLNQFQRGATDKVERNASQRTVSTTVTSHEAGSGSQSQNNSLQVADSTISIAMVIDHEALKEMLERSSLYGLSPDEQLQVAVDISNLSLANSGITDYSFSLGKVIYLSPWESVTSFENNAADNTSEASVILGLAVARGQADRVAFIGGNNVMTNDMSGDADQWRFANHDMNNGALYSQFFSRVLKVNASVVATNTLTHEVGHTMGLGHERGANALEYDFALPYGFTTSDKIGTVMSYGQGCVNGCANRIDSFSNPDTQIDGAQAGKSAAEEDAADAATFLNATWPLTTQTEFNLIDLHTVKATGNMVVTWDAPSGLTAQHIFIAQQACPILPSPQQIMESGFSTIPGFNRVDLSATENRYTINNSSAEHCVILIGDYIHGGAQLSRALGMTNTGMTKGNTILDTDMPNISVGRGQTVSFDINMKGVTVENEYLNVDVQAVDAVTSHLTRSPVTPLQDSIFADLLSISFEGSGDTRTAVVSLSDDVAAFNAFINNASYDQFTTGELRVRISIFDEYCDYETYTLVSINLKDALSSLPDITLQQGATVFSTNDTESKVINAIVQNVTQSSEISVTLLDDAGSLNLENTVITDLGDNRFQVTANVSKQSSIIDVTGVRIAIANTHIEQIAYVFEESWASINFSDSQLNGEVGENHYLYGAVSNVDFDAGEEVTFTINYGDYEAEIPAELIAAGNGTYNFRIELNADMIGEFQLTVTRWVNGESTQLAVNTVKIYAVGEMPRSVTTPLDYDGDGKSELTIRRGLTNTQISLRSTDHQLSPAVFGGQTDIPVAGDFDGDGKADVAVRQAETGIWFIQNSFDQSLRSEFLGDNFDDIPVIGDYDGDGTDDIAVYRPSSGTWYIKRSSDGLLDIKVFGLNASDIPAQADYDGDGITDFAVRRVTTRMFIIESSATGRITRHYFGNQADDIPVPADYDGDGRADIAVRRPSSKMWFVKYSSNGEIFRTGFGGQRTDIPAVGDYDGDGKADIAVRRASSGFFFVLNSSDNAIVRTYFGSQSSDIPIAAPVSIRMLMAQQFGTYSEGNPQQHEETHSELMTDKAELFSAPVHVTSDAQ